MPTRPRAKETDTLTGVLWDRVLEGDTVEVERPGEYAGDGVVDAVSTDGGLVWVQMHDGRGRILVHIDDGAQLRLRSASSHSSA